MFSKLASNLKSNVENHVVKEDSRFNIILNNCKINNISCCVQVFITGSIAYDFVNIALSIRTNLGIRDIDDDMNTREMFFKWIVDTKRKEEINYEQFYEEVYSIIPTLRISKQKGKFLTEDDSSLAVEEEITKLFTHPNVEIDTCCVCREICGGVKIICGHNICIECITQIKPKKDEEDEECFYIYCPLCREKIGE